MFVILQKERFIAENDLKRDESLQKGLHQQFPKSIAQSIVDPLTFYDIKMKGEMFLLYDCLLIHCLHLLIIMKARTASFKINLFSN